MIRAFIDRYHRKLISRNADQSIRVGAHIQTDQGWLLVSLEVNQRGDLTLDVKHGDKPGEPLKLWDGTVSAHRTAPNGIARVETRHVLEFVRPENEVARPTWIR